jgi:uncharacterized membrane protein YgcG
MTRPKSVLEQAKGARHAASSRGFSMPSWTLRAVAACAVVVVLTSAAAADDWIASQLRGQVWVLVDGNWQPLARGNIVPDTRSVRTGDNGHVTFTRGGETVTLDADTQIQIFDRAHGVSVKPFTTVKEAYGTVSIEAEVENVQHFSVETPYLAAVVKGTKFVVTSGKGGANVVVHRGHVEVDDPHNKTHVVISVGQSASVDSGKSGGVIAVSGTGKLPAVINANSKAVVATGTTTTSDTGKSSKSGDDPVGDDKSGDGSGKGSSGSGTSGSGDNSGSSGKSASGDSGNPGDHGNSGRGIGLSRLLRPLHPIHGGKGKGARPV